MVLLLQLHRQTSCHSTSQPVFRDVVHVGVCRLAGDHGGHLAWLAPDLSSAQTPRATSNAFQESSARTSAPSTSPPPEDTSSPTERALHQLAHCVIRSCDRSWITLNMSLALSRSDICDIFTDSFLHLSLRHKPSHFHDFLHFLTRRVHLLATTTAASL